MFSNKVFKLVFIFSAFLFMSACEDTSKDEPNFMVTGEFNAFEGELTLVLNDQEELIVYPDPDRMFEFRSKLLSGSKYEVTVSEHPSGQYCGLLNATGTIEEEDVDILVYCRSYFRGLVGATELSSGTDHVCAIADGEVECWGKNDRGQLNVPYSLSNPIKIAAGTSVSCAIDDSGVVCWGDIEGLGTMPDNIVNAREIAAGFWGVCVIDDNGLLCWGNDDHITDYPKELANPHSLVISIHNACVIDGSRPVCWGFYQEAVTVPESLTEVDFIDITNSYACAYGGQEVTCWGSRIAGREVDGVVVFASDDLGPVSGISTGSLISCVLSEGEAKCWGKGGFLSRTADITYLTDSFKQLDISQQYACGIDEEGVICSGTSYYW